MSGQVSTKTEKDKGAGHTEGSSRRTDNQSSPLGRPAGILALQRSAGNNAVNSLVNSLGGGTPLPIDLRSEMEQDFGEDFSRVRLHTDAHAALSADELNAKAYTVGNNIVFNDGRFNPGTNAGKRLLAHELTHVLQQRKGHIESVKETTAEIISKREDQADQVGRQVSAPEYLSSTTDAKQDGPITSAIAPVPPGTLQGQFITPHDAGGGFGGLIKRDSQAIFADEGSAADPAYAEIAHAIQAGWREIAALDEPTLRRATIEQRVVMLTQLVEAYWTGSAEEEAIIRILSTTPSANAPDLVERLNAPLANGSIFLDELNRVVDLGNNLDLHAEISRLRLRARPAAQGVEALRTAPVLPWHDVMGFFEDNATFHFWLSEQGMIRISYHRGTVLLSSTDFADEIRQLPVDLFINGYDYKPDQLLIIHDYDSDRLVPVVARDLLGYRNAGIRAFFSHAGQAASMALPAGPAKTAVGKVAVITLERVLPLASTIVNENRLNIIKWFPKWGRQMLYFNDLVQMAVGLYGIVRFAVSGARIIKSWREARNSRALLEGAALDPTAEVVARQFESQFDQIAKELEKINASEDVGALQKVPSQLPVQPNQSALGPGRAAKPGGAILDELAATANRSAMPGKDVEVPSQLLASPKGRMPSGSVVTEQLPGSSVGGLRVEPGTAPMVLPESPPSAASRLPNPPLKDVATGPEVLASVSKDRVLSTFQGYSPQAAKGAVSPAISPPKPFEPKRGPSEASGPGRFPYLFPGPSPTTQDDKKKFPAPESQDTRKELPASESLDTNKEAPAPESQNVQKDLPGKQSQNDPELFYELGTQLSKPGLYRIDRMPKTEQIKAWIEAEAKNTEGRHVLLVDINGKSVLLSVSGSGGAEGHTEYAVIQYLLENNMLKEGDWLLLQGIFAACPFHSTECGMCRDVLNLVSRELNVETIYSTDALRLDLKEAELDRLIAEGARGVPKSKEAQKQWKGKILEEEAEKANRALMYGEAGKGLWRRSKEDYRPTREETNPSLEKLRNLIKKRKKSD